MLGVKGGYSRVSYRGDNFGDKPWAQLRKRHLNTPLAATTTQAADAYLRALPRAGPAYLPTLVTNQKCEVSIGLRETHQRSLESPSLDDVTSGELKMGVASLYTNART